MRQMLALAVAAGVLAAMAAPAAAEGDVEKGKEVFKKCGLCHQVGPGAKTLIGPELNGIVGRKAASIADYPSYSAGMKKLGADGLGVDAGKYRQMDRRPQGHDPRFAHGAGLSGHSRCRTAGRRDRLSEDAPGPIGSISRL